MNALDLLQPLIALLGLLLVQNEPIFLVGLHLVQPPQSFAEAGVIDLAADIQFLFENGLFVRVHGQFQLQHKRRRFCLRHGSSFRYLFF